MRSFLRSIPAAALVLVACAVPVGHTAPVPAGVRPISGVRALRRAIDSVANAPEFSNANWGILVIDGRGDTLYSRNAGKLFMPASNQKILTSSVALTQLGPDYRSRTTFVGLGFRAESTWVGNLLVIGRGDPSVSDHMRGDAMIPLREIADSLRAHGINRINGSIRPEGNAFPDPVLGFGWSWDDLEADYSAPTDELLFNEGFTNVVVTAGAAPGDTAHIATRPTHGWPKIRGAVLTVPPVDLRDSVARLHRPRVSVVKDTLTGEVVVSGTIAVGDSDVEAVTHRDPDAAYVAALREALEDRGIVVTDTVTMPGDPLPARLDTIAILQSPPLRDILPPFLKPSQNQMGEMLFKTIGLERDTVGSAAAARRVVTAQLEQWGARDDGYIIRDGSGLSRYDYVSPETIVRVLDAMRHSPSFQVFYDALPIGGVDGTIANRMRGTPAEGNVHAKTGSVSQARSLSGYVRSLAGDTLTFSLLANNWSVPSSHLTAAGDSIVARLASFRR